MPRRRDADHDPRQGLLGIYALAQMAREGPVHGYRISERISERTEGAWRPGPGAVYPALQRLTRRGLARSRVEGRRRVYSITPEGRTMLAHLRARSTSRASHGPDLAVLWAEVSGMDDVAAFLLMRLRRSLDAIDNALASPVLSGAGSPGLKTLRTDVMGELTFRLEQLRRREGATSPAIGLRPGARGR